MSHTEHRITIVCYDIASDKLRNKIDKCMKDFGVRLQYSIYMCALDSEGISRCRDKLLSVVEKYNGDKEMGDSVIMIEAVDRDMVDNLLGARFEQNMSDHLVI